MKRTLVLLIALGILMTGPLCTFAADVAPGKLVPPPAIYMPSGGKIVTDINLSDSDVLGIIKQSIPAAAESLKDLAPMLGAGGNQSAAGMLMIANSVDIQGFMDAISGIKNIRFIIAQYPSAKSPETFIAEFDAGAAKAGGFSRVLGDIAFSPGGLAVYAQPNNAGYMGFVYNPDENVAYAVRIVGFVDVPKLIKWGGSVAKLVGQMKMSVAAPVVSPESPAAPAPVAAPSK